MASGRLSVSLLVAAVLVVCVCVAPALFAPNGGSTRAERVEGFAHDFVTGEGIVHADLRMLEDPHFAMKTDENGRFAFDVPVGSNVTLVINKWSIHETQTSTVTVPQGGLVGRQKELTLQVPDVPTYAFLEAVLPGKTDPNQCHLVATITAKGKTLYDDPQGEANSTITVDPPVPMGPNVFYFGIFMGKTDPFTRGLNSTSLDGGVLLFNVPLGDYVISAHKEGVVFGDPATAVMKCRNPGRFINASPPWGPRAI